jgi:hypothetical protein
VRKWFETNVLDELLSTHVKSTSSENNSTGKPRRFAPICCSMFLSYPADDVMAISLKFLGSFAQLKQKKKKRGRWDPERKTKASPKWAKPDLMSEIAPPSV